jgi:hypothetical protein
MEELAEVRRSFRWSCAVAVQKAAAALHLRLCREAAFLYSRAPHLMRPRQHGRLNKVQLVEQAAAASARLKGIARSAEHTARFQEVHARTATHALHTPHSTHKHARARARTHARTHTHTHTHRDCERKRLSECASSDSA